jgi:uncharacterized membrane protein YdcZ (DUF606 family)
MSDRIFLALIAGLMTPLQAAINARVGRMLRLPIWAAAMFGAVFTVALIMIGLLTTALPCTKGAAEVTEQVIFSLLDRMGLFGLIAQPLTPHRVGSLAEC